MRGLIRLLRLAVVGKNCDNDDGSLRSGFAILRKSIRSMKFTRLCCCEKSFCY